jgi:hypothetical protein
MERLDGYICEIIQVQDECSPQQIKPAEHRVGFKIINSRVCLKMA